MKKITPILVGLALSASANAYDLSQKFYAGINLGGSIPTLSTTAKEFQTATGQSFKKNSIAGDIHVGKRFGAFGLELSAGLLDSVSMSLPASTGLTSVKATDYLFALDLGYYMPVNDQFSVRGTLGLGALYSRNTVAVSNTALLGSIAAKAVASGFAATDKLMGYTTTTMQSLTNGTNTSSTFKLAPKVGVGAVFAVHQNVSLTAAANFIYPIKNDHVKYLFNLNVGANYHF